MRCTYAELYYRGLSFQPMACKFFTAEAHRVRCRVILKIPQTVDGVGKEAEAHVWIRAEIKITGHFRFLTPEVNAAAVEAAAEMVDGGIGTLDLDLDGTALSIKGAIHALEVFCGRADHGADTPWFADFSVRIGEEERPLAELCRGARTNERAA
jgi:hypothetical protein